MHLTNLPTLSREHFKFQSVTIFINNYANIHPYLISNIIGNDFVKFTNIRIIYIFVFLHCNGQFCQPFHDTM